MRIATDRCIIRDFDEADINEAHQYLSNPKTMYFIEDPYTPEQTEEFIHEYGACGEPYVYALVLKDSNKVIGHVIFHKYDYESIYEIGIIIDTPYQKQGIGYEVLSALIKYAFGSMDIHKIVAETIEGNDACVKLLEKLSLTRESTLRKQNWDHDNWVDEYHYGLLREEVV